MSVTTPFAPTIVTPSAGQRFNRGIVQITWNRSDSPAPSPSITADQVTCELEYTDRFDFESTVWIPLKRRIPFTQVTYDWNVGKMVKSKTARLRIRARNSDTQEVSDWSMSDEFSINVFELIAPAIVSPLPNSLHTDYVLVILDESLTRETFNQKVSYTLEFASVAAGVDWTIIVKDIPFGKNVIRWNIDGLPNADDYVLQLTAKDWNSEQISRSYVYNIRIQHSGLFLIDTKPPQTVIQIEGATQVTNQLNHIVNVFAEDATSEVKNIRMRECNATNNLKLGIIDAEEETASEEDPCAELTSLLAAKPINNTSKIEWSFQGVDADGNPVSATKKVEALVSDVGGNTSLQEQNRVFLPILDLESDIGDFAIVIEARVNTIDGTAATYEVVYAGTSTGQLWVLEPFARLIYTITGTPSITKLVEYNDSLYIFAYSLGGIGQVYRHNGSSAVLIYSFSSALSQVTTAAAYGGYLFVGLANGQLWRYDASSFSLIDSFSEPINYLYADNIYLYIGFQNSDSVVLYNGTTFTTLGLEA